VTFGYEIPNLTYYLISNCTIVGYTVEGKGYFDSIGYLSFLPLLHH